MFPSSNKVLQPDMLVGTDSLEWPEVKKRVIIGEMNVKDDDDL